MPKLEEWLKNVPHRVLCGTAEEAVEDVVYDSRSSRAHTVFVCMKGSRFDSHALIGEIAKTGCRSFVVEVPAEELSLPEEHSLNLIYVEDARRALALISAARFGEPLKKLTSIGVTGTKGKTTFSYMMSRLLSCAGKRVGVIGTNGCEIAGVHYETKNTTPESYELHALFAKMAEAGCTHVVMECSSQGFKMHRTDGIVFDYGVFLNISPDHIGPLEHADFEEYLHCKAMLLSQAKHVLVNADDAHIGEILAASGRSDAEERPVTFGIGNLSADVRAEAISYLADGTFVGTEFTVSGCRSAAGDPLPDAKLRLSLPGSYNVSNALPALAIAFAEGADARTAGDALSDLHVNGRTEIVYRSDRFQVIVDYAHNEVSMESLLETLRAYRPKRLVVVFGCGGNRSKERRSGMGAAAARTADYSIFTADNSRFEKPEDIIADIEAAYLAAGGEAARCCKIPDRREAIRYAVLHAQDGDMIAVIGKGHETYQEIEGVRTHFSDQEEIRAAVAEREAKR